MLSSEYAGIKACGVAKNNIEGKVYVCVCGIDWAGPREIKLPKGQVEINTPEDTQRFCVSRVHPSSLLSHFPTNVYCLAHMFA